MAEQTIFPSGLAPSVQVRLAVSGEPVFGPGVAELLENITQEGSVLGACTAMRLSYSKGRKMLKKLEQFLRTPVVKCTQGGRSGGSAHLTEAGWQLLACYNSYERAVEQYSARAFSAFFPVEGGTSKEKVRENL